jgi:hypothetical protein
MIEQWFWILFWTAAVFIGVRRGTLRAFNETDGVELTKRNGDNGLSWACAAIAAFFTFVAAADIILNMTWTA